LLIDRVAGAPSRTAPGRTRAVAGKRGRRLRARAEKVSDTTRDTYHEWAECGKSRIERIRTQPQIARALRGAENLNERVTTQIDTIVDELHDAGEDLLGRVSTETRSVGEKTARRTQRVTRDVAAGVAEGASELAGEIVDAGDEAAHDTRNATRKAANKTAPTGAVNGRQTTTR
jgi:heparin binding hemagglutinin HbhA